MSFGLPMFPLSFSFHVSEDNDKFPDGLSKGRIGEWVQSLIEGRSIVSVVPVLPGE